MLAIQTTGGTHTFYEILELSSDALEDHCRGGESAQAIIKRAYHRALLKHHPDKVFSKERTGNSTSHANSKYVTVDRISDAFAVLSDPARRAEYDRTLKLVAGPSLGLALQQFQTGVENVDLDDLAFDESSLENPLWYRDCRCGNPRGYSFGEADLEEASQYGAELMVGCTDCSLWLRVHFAILDDGGDEDDKALDVATCNEVG